MSPEKKHRYKSTTSSDEASLSSENNGLSPVKQEPLKLPFEEEGEASGPEDETKFQGAESIPTQ